MATELDDPEYTGRFVRPANQFEAARVAAASPSRMRIAGQDTSGMTNAQIAQEKQYLAQPDWAKRRQTKNFLRGATQEQRLQHIEDYALRARALEGTGAGLPENRVSLKSPSGPTLDQYMAMDYTRLSPETRAMYDAGVKAFNQQASQLMSSADTSKWQSEDDAEAAFNALPALRDYGSMIEGHAFSTMRKMLSRDPKMKVRFEANDRNVESFSQWFNNKVRTEEGFLGHDYEDPAILWGGVYTERAQKIKQQFMEDANAEKWRERNGKLELVKPTAEQIRGQQLKAQRESDEITNRQNVEKAQEVYDQLPQEQKDQFIVGPKGNLIRLPERRMSVDQQRAELEAQGLDRDYIDKNYDIKPTQHGSVLVHKKVDAQALRREGRAEQYIATGIPIAAMSDGTPDTEKALSNVEIWQGNQRVSGKLLGGMTKAQKDANIASGKWQYKLKEGLKPWTPPPETATAATSAPAAPQQAQPSAPQQAAPVASPQARPPATPEQLQSMLSAAKAKGDTEAVQYFTKKLNEAKK